MHSPYSRYDDIKQRQQRWWPMAIADFIWNREFFCVYCVAAIWLKTYKRMDFVIFFSSSVILFSFHFFFCDSSSIFVYLYVVVRTCFCARVRPYERVNMIISLSLSTVIYQFRNNKHEWHVTSEKNFYTDTHTQTKATEKNIFEKAWFYTAQTVSKYERYNKCTYTIRHKSFVVK